MTGDDTVPAASDLADGGPDLVRVGRYRLLRVLGEGGMGTVYEAEQDEPVRRRVALKLIKPGMDSRDVVARFEAERQALAVMDHPNIARVHDGGSTETGRPYFVMELVRGVPITEYCDTHKLSMTERLELFMPVCHAVHHAHQKGVIHRDLKPANVLVGVDTSEPTPMVIDFGVAKAIGHRLTEKTLVTQLGHMIGTPAYMSPEQAEASGLDVDTRTDVYSLGVMLYELLTGALPFDWTSKPADAVLPYLLRESDPLTPSRRFEGLGHRKHTVAILRHTDPGSLRRQLRGDVDWIVMKAMEKDRTRRYESAAALAADIRRHVNNQIVEARAPSAGYRARRFVRRHWAGVTAAAVAFTALLVATIVASVGLARARVAEREATREAQTAQRVSDFVVELFEVVDPSEARGNTITAREILDRGVANVRTALAHEPAVQARVMQVMGRVYRGIGLYAPAGSLLTDAVATGREHLGSQTTEVALALQDLASVLGRLGRRDDAVTAAEEALATVQQTLGPDDPGTAYGHQVLGIALRDLGEFEQARVHLVRSLEIRERLNGPAMEVAWSLGHLGWLHFERREPDTALAYFARAVAIAEEELGDDDPRLAEFLSDYGAALVAVDDFDAGREYHQRALALRERTLGPDHLFVGHSLNNLGSLEWRTGDLAAARLYYERAVAVQREALGDENPALGLALGNFALLLQSLGEYRESLERYREALAVQEAGLGPDHIDLTNNLNNFGWMLRTIGQYAAASFYLERAVSIRERVLGAEHPSIVQHVANLFYANRDRGDYVRARDAARRWLALTEQRDPPDSAGMAVALTFLGQVLHLGGDLDSAARVLLRADSLQPDTPDNVIERATVAHRRRSIAEADSLFAHWLALQGDAQGRETAAFAYSEAAVWALRGERTRALDRLRSLVDDGYAELYLIRDPHLLPLHGEPVFEGIVAEVKRRAGVDGIRVPVPGT